MSNLLPLLLILLASLTPLPKADGVGSSSGDHCPTPLTDGDWRVRNLLTTPFISELRARFDLGSATADHIEPLADERYAETCRRLWEAVRTSGTKLASGDRLSFYRSGDRFFVPINREPPPAEGVVLRLDGYSSVDVYDAGFRLVGRFGG